MKTKIFTILLIVAMAILTFASCDASTNKNGYNNNYGNTYEDNQNNIASNNGNSNGNSNGTSGEVVTPPASTKHTEHEGNGECSKCGLNYFEVMSDYIKENGTDVGYSIFRMEMNDQIITYNSGAEVIVFEYDDVEVWVDEISVKYGNYEVRYSDYSDYSNVQSYHGNFDATSVLPGREITVTTTKNTFSRESEAEEKVKLGVEIIVNEFIVEFIEMCGSELSPLDLCFDKFD